MSRRLTCTLVFGFLLACAALAASRDQDAIAQLLKHDASALALKAALIVCAGGLVLVMFGERLSQVFETALFWCVIALVGIVGFSYRFELLEIGERGLATAVAGYHAIEGRNVELVRSAQGDFPVTARINGVRVPMVLDTGATSVVLTHDAAKAAGLPLAFLNYSVRVDTANGRTRAAPVTLARLAVGGVIEREVPALIAQPGTLQNNLLGMSFLNRLESWEVRGDRLKLRGYP